MISGSSPSLGLGVGLTSSFLSGGVGLGSSDFLAQEAKREAPTKRRARARAVLLIFFILLRVDYKYYGYGLHVEGAVVIARLGGLVILLHLIGSLLEGASHIAPVAGGVLQQVTLVGDDAYRQEDFEDGRPLDAGLRLVGLGADEAVLIVLEELRPRALLEADLEVEGGQLAG